MSLDSMLVDQRRPYFTNLMSRNINRSSKAGIELPFIISHYGPVPVNF